MVDRIEPEQLDNPSPCEAWTVRDVLNHITGGAEMFAICVRDGSVSDEKLGELMTGDNLGDDYKASFHRAADDANAGVRDPRAPMDRIVKLPFGEMPAGMAVNIAIFDVDHARLGPRQGDRPEHRPRPRGRRRRVPGRADHAHRRLAQRRACSAQPVAVPDDVPVADRLAGLAGRTP